MGREKLSRRDFLRISAVAMGGAALVGCGAVAPSSNAPAAAGTTAPADGAATEAPAVAAEPTVAAPPTTAEGTISYWTFWGNYGDTVPQWEEALKARLAPLNVDIRTGVDAEQVFLTAVAAGTPPDVGTGHKYVDYFSKGQAVPLDELVAASSVIKQSDFSEAAWRGMQWEGKILGVSGIEAFVRRGLNYNTRMVEEAGLDPDKPPVTWDEVMEWHQKLTKFDDAGNLLQFGLDPMDAEGGVFAENDGTTILDSWGEQWYDVDAKKFNINTPAMVEGFRTYADLIKVIGADKLTGFRSVEGQGSWGGSFTAEKQAMIIEGYWHPGETTNEKAEVGKLNRASWLPVPEARRGKKIQQGGGHMVLFYKGAKNPAQAAWPVAEFINTKEHCDPVYQGLGWLPDYKPYLSQVDPSPFPGLKFYVDSVNEADEWYYPILNPIASFAQTKFSQTMEAVYRDQMTPEQGAEELQAALEQEWREGGYA
jgi:multiple sugar transport system substrate-binding protein